MKGLEDIPEIDKRVDSRLARDSAAQITTQVRSMQLLDKRAHELADNAGRARARAGEQEADAAIPTAKSR